MVLGTSIKPQSRVPFSLTRDGRVVGRNKSIRLSPGVEDSKYLISNRKLYV